MTLNSQKMNLDYIRTFVVLGQSRNMTQASQKLNVTTSYVSRHVRQLEEELETKLIAYSSKNHDLELTEAGKYFFDKYEKIYNDFLLTEKNFKQSKNINYYKIIIGINADLIDVFLKKKLKKFMSKHTNISIRVFTNENCQLLKMLNQGRIDLMIYKTNSSETLSKEIQTSTISKSKYCFVYNPELLCFKDISSSPLILPFQGTEDRVFINNYLKQHNVLLPAIYEFENFKDILSYVIQGCGVGFVLKENIRDYSFLRVIDIDSLVNINISFVKEMKTPLISEFLNSFGINVI